MRIELIRLFCSYLLLVSTGVSLLGIDPVPETVLRSQLELAKQASTEGRLDDALRHFLALKEQESDFEAYTDLYYRFETKFASALGEAQAYRLALVEAKKAMQLSLKLAKNDPQAHRYSLGRVGGLHLQLNEPDSAIYFFRRELVWSRTRLAHNPIMNAAARNNLGMAFLEMHQPDSARHYFETALQLFSHTDHTDDDLLAAIMDNVATLYASTRQYEQAYVAYQQNLDLADQLHNSYREMQALVGLAEVSLRQKDFTKAYKYLNRASTTMPQLSYKNQMRFQRKLYEQWITYTRYKKDWRANASYQRMASQLSDSVSHANQALLTETLEKLAYHKLAQISKDLEVQELLLERQNEALVLAEQEVRFRALLLLVMVITGLLLLVGVWGFFRRRALAQNKQRELLEVQKELSEAQLRNRELESQRLSNELAAKKKDLSDLAIYLANLRELHDNLVERLQRIRQQPEEIQSENLRNLITDLASRTGVDQKTSVIQENIAQVNQEFYEKLHHQFPGLTKSETELCGLLRLHLANKEIAALRNVSPNSVKMSRYRLRKKLELQPEENIYSFLQKF